MVTVLCLLNVHIVSLIEGLRISGNCAFVCFVCGGGVQLDDSKVSNVPVAIIASNRPHYLYR